MTTTAQSVRQVKSPAVAWVLWLVLGVFGGHRFYLNRPWTGLLWLFTAGLFLVGWLVDAGKLNAWVRRANTVGY